MEYSYYTIITFRGEYYTKIKQANFELALAVDATLIAIKCGLRIHIENPTHWSCVLSFHLSATCIHILLINNTYVFTYAWGTCLLKRSVDIRMLHSEEESFGHLINCSPIVGCFIVLYLLLCLCTGKLKSLPLSFTLVLPLPAFSYLSSFCLYSLFFLRIPGSFSCVGVWGVKLLYNINDKI